MPWHLKYRSPLTFRQSWGVIAMVFFGGPVLHDASNVAKHHPVEERGRPRLKMLPSNVQNNSQEKDPQNECTASTSVDVQQYALAGDGVLLMRCAVMH